MYSPKYSFSVQLVKAERNIIIKIMSSDTKRFRWYYFLLAELRKFEMLFVGGFYTVDEVSFGNAYRNKNIQLKHDLPFYDLKPINYSCEMYQRDLYCKYFNRWLVLSEEHGIIHQMFLYSVSSIHMPVDILMALLSLTYQPLYKHLVMKIKIVPVVSEKSYICKKCGASKAIKIGPEFNECLTTI